jgi:hypothetical protein
LNDDMQTKAKFAADLSKRQKRRREVSRVTERERRDEAAKAHERAEFIAALRTATVDLHGPRPGRFDDARAAATAAAAATDDNTSVTNDDDDSTVHDESTTAASAAAVAASQMETFARILNRAPSSTSGMDFPALSAPNSATKSTNNTNSSSTNTPHQPAVWGKPSSTASPVLTARERESEFLMELTLTNSSSKKGKKRIKVKHCFQMLVQEVVVIGSQRSFQTLTQ